MNNRKQELINHLENFINICNKNKIWYAAASTTLLGTIAKEGIIPWNEKIEIMMTIDSYKLLRKVASEYLIDGSMDHTYPAINPKFIPKNSSFDSTNIFIDILIATPTTTQKVKKWSSLAHKNNFLCKKLHSNYIPYNANEKILKFISMPFKRMYKQLTYKTAYNRLYALKNEGFFLIHRPSCKPFQHWIPHLTFNTEERKFENLTIKIPAEWNTILEVKYGKNYKNIAEKKVVAEYQNSVSMKKLPKEK